MHRFTCEVKHTLLERKDVFFQQVHDDNVQKADLYERIGDAFHRRFGEKRRRAAKKTEPDTSDLHPSESMSGSPYRGSDRMFCPRRSASHFGGVLGKSLTDCRDVRCVPIHANPSLFEE